MGHMQGIVFLSTMKQAMAPSLWLCWCASRVGVVLIDALAMRIARGFPSLTTTSSVRHVWTGTDVGCILLNGLLEAAFLQWIWTVTCGLNHASWCSPVWCVFLFVFDDALYTPYHWLLHQSSTLYRLVHARHHKTHHPDLGYWHASMENPLEMAGALLLSKGVVTTLTPYGLDAGAVWMHVTLRALGACLNHTAHDVRFGNVYASVYHREHHAQRKGNFAQTIMLVDEVFGTRLRG